MKKTMFIFLLLIVTINVFSQAPNWLWAKSAGGDRGDLANSVTVDASGNTYVTGTFYSSTLTFDTTTLMNALVYGSRGDMFLVKYDANGNVLWAKCAGDRTGNDCGTSIALDASGNIYVAGYFTGSTISFDSTTLTNFYDVWSDIFLVKYDANGNVLWAKCEGGNDNDEPLSVSVDASGNIYVAGYFQSSTLIFDSTTLSNAGYMDIFLAKYDTNGNVLWAKSAGGDAGDFANSVSVDASGNIYVAGDFVSPTLNFGSTALTNTHGYSYDIFLAKYDSNGNVLWAKCAGGGTDFNDKAYAVAVDAAGHTYMAGYFKSPTITFDSTTLTNEDNTGNSEDLFLAKYDANGNVIWAKKAGGTSTEEAHSVAVDNSGNIYMAGLFCSSILTFGSTTLTNTNILADIFLVKYDSNGSVLWAKSLGSTDSDAANSIAVDDSGNIYLAGDFNSPSLTFDFTTLMNAGYSDIFLTKLDSRSVTGLDELNSLLNISVFPNPNMDMLTLKVDASISLSIQSLRYQLLDISGQLLNSEQLISNETLISLANRVTGIYILKILDNQKEVKSFKIIKK